MVGVYRLETVLGRGGMGVVFLATDTRLKRQVAVKVIAPERSTDTIFRLRFARESQLAASIEHPNSVAVYEVGESDDGQVFIAMRYVQGTDLRALLQKEQWLEPPRAATLVGQVAGALDEAHKHGLVHRDVKPGNVLIGEVGGEEWAYLTDFGATKPAAPGSGDITSTGEWMGTADYASPEQIGGERVDARSDVYSLGCVLFEALTGRIPFERENQVATLYAHVNDPPPLVSEIVPDAPRNLDGVVQRALAKDPDERYPSAGDLGRATHAAIAGQDTLERERSVAKGEAKAGVLADQAPTRTLPRRSTGRLPWRGRPLVAGAAIAAVIALLAAAYLLLSGSDDDFKEVATINVGQQPIGVAYGDDAVFVSVRGEREVVRIDPETNSVTDQAVRVGREPAGLAVGLGSVWVANSGDGTVTRIAPESGATQDYRVGQRPAGIRVGEDAVWVANLESDTVSRIDPESGRVQSISVGDAPSGIGLGENGVWVSNSGDDSVTRIRPTTGEVLKTVLVGETPRGVAVGKGSVWVANTLDGTVTRLDADTYERIGEPIDVGPARGSAPAGVAVGEEWVFVLLEGEEQLVRIDPDSGELAGDPIDVGQAPRALDIGGDAVWVSNSGGESVSRIEG